MQKALHITVRRLIAGDETLALQAAESFDRALDAVAVAAFLQDDDNVLMLAYANGVPAGSAIAYFQARLDGQRPKLLLYDLNVVERFRRQGVARRLIEELVRLARARQALSMWVPTTLDNLAAKQLYENTGGRANPAGDIIYWYELGEAKSKDPRHNYLTE